MANKRSTSRYITSPLEARDIKSGFCCGKHPLDDYFARHALPNDQAGIGRAYVRRRTPRDPDDWPEVVGFYTLSMASAAAADLSKSFEKKLPQYPMPVALIGRFAIDKRAQGRGLGPQLLIDALRRVVDAAVTVGCLGTVVDAKDEEAQAFYSRYDFLPFPSYDAWPRRMFLPIGTARAAFRDP